MFVKFFAAFAAVLVCAGLFSGFGRTSELSPHPEQNREVTTPLAQEITPTVTTEKEYPPQTTVTVHLTHSEAEQAALDHAGLQTREVVFARTEYDIDNGVPVWDVEFRHGDYEYDYTVHAENGQILKYERDYEPTPQTEPKPQIKPTEAETQQPVAEVIPAPQEQPSTEVTKEQAIAIALAHAGLRADEVKGLYAERDRDDGIVIYEIEFRHGNTEYEYDIRVTDGAILDWDRDIDD